MTKEAPMMNEKLAINDIGYYCCGCFIVPFCSKGTYNDFGWSLVQEHTKNIMINIVTALICRKIRSHYVIISYNI